MNFKPKSESEVSSLFEKGIYKFKVLRAEERTSKSGNQMIKLSLVLYHNQYEGKTTTVDSYLVDNPNFEYLIRHFCYAVGLEQEYESGKLNERDCSSKEGFAEITIEKDKTGQYKDKNRVVDFIMKSADLNKDNGYHMDSNVEDDIPF